VARLASFVLTRWGKSDEGRNGLASASLREEGLEGTAKR
jgi:hypothetical protein